MVKATECAIPTVFLQKRSSGAERFLDATRYRLASCSHRLPFNSVKPNTIRPVAIDSPIR